MQQQQESVKVVVHPPGDTSLVTTVTELAGLAIAIATLVAIIIKVRRKK